MSKHIVLDVPKGRDPEFCLNMLRNTLYEVPSTVGEPMADSARLVDLEAMRKHPEMDDHMCANHRQGCVACERGTGYNAAIDEILGGK
ncbi:MAG: hypothetical protein ABIL09_01100 [Gemmatimonadota bacterium]